MNGKKLQGQVALITGGARGLGRGYALHLASLGADIAIIDRNLKGAEVYEFERELMSAETVMAECEALGVRAMGLHEVQVRSGRKTDVSTDSKPRSLEVPANLDVYLRSWPGIPMPRSAGRVLLPGGGPPLRVLVRIPLENGALLEQRWVEAEPEGIPDREFPRRPVLVTDTSGAPLAGARVISVRSPAGGSRVESATVSDQHGRAEVPITEQSDPRSLVVIAPGFSPVAVAWTAETTTRVELSRGHQADLQVLDPRGDPVAGLPVRLIQPSSPLLTTNYTTDRLGSLKLDGLPIGRLGLRLTHPTLLDRDYPIEIHAGPPQSVRIQADRGFQLVGNVLLPDGKPASGALVSVRDTTGRIGVQEKTAVSGVDGAFEIGGLPEDLRLRLAAKLTLEKTSYISQQVWVRPGGSRWEIELKREDPDLAGRRKKKDGRQPPR